MYNGFDWYGRILEVREDRYAGLTGPGFRGGFRGGPRGGMRGLRGGPFGGRGGFRGGFMGGTGPGAGGGRDFNQDIYADYSGPDGGAPNVPNAAPAARAIPTGPGAMADQGFGQFNSPYAPGYIEPEPSQQIMVRNLPWSTANEDLVELFETTGQVELAEILYDGSRSKGCGVVQFSAVNEAETAIAKFQAYMYGGRPLGMFCPLLFASFYSRLGVDVRYNDRWHTFTPTAAKGGSVQPIAAEAA